MPDITNEVRPTEEGLKKSRDPLRLIPGSRPLDDPIEVQKATEEAFKGDRLLDPRGSA